MMDDAIRAELESILDNWKVSRTCPYCKADGIYKYKHHATTIEAISLELFHDGQCPYTRIATLINRDACQRWSKPE